MHDWLWYSWMMLVRKLYTLVYSTIDYFLQIVISREIGLVLYIGCFTLVKWNYFCQFHDTGEFSHWSALQEQDLFPTSLNQPASTIRGSQWLHFSSHYFPYNGLPMAYLTSILLIVTVTVPHRLWMFERPGDLQLNHSWLISTLFINSHYDCTQFAQWMSPIL